MKIYQFFFMLTACYSAMAVFFWVPFFNNPSYVIAYPTYFHTANFFLRALAWNPSPSYFSKPILFLLYVPNYITVSLQRYGQAMLGSTISTSVLYCWTFRGVPVNTQKISLYICGFSLFLFFTLWMARTQRLLVTRSSLRYFVCFCFPIPSADCSVCFDAAIWLINSKCRALIRFKPSTGLKYSQFQAMNSNNFSILS